MIASAVGGIPELIVQGVTGRLVESENTSALREAMLDYLAHPQRGIEEGKRGKEKGYNGTIVSRLKFRRLKNCITQLLAEKAQCDGVSCVGRDKKTKA